MLWGGVAFGQRATDEADDALERYLSQRRFTALRIQHLEQRLAASETEDARNELARRLAEAYAAMVEQSSDHGERRMWTERSRDLIEAAQGEEADELRLSLAQARFRALEQGVRAWRLRLDLPEQAGGGDGGDGGGGIGRIEADLIEVTAEMGALADRANNRARALERQRNRAQAGELIFLEEEIAQANRRRSLGHYLAGWAAYHTAEIQAARLRDELSATGVPLMGSAMQKAEDAQKHFAWLLGAEGDEIPGTDRLSDALLGYEHVARAALGFALAESIRGINETARIDSALDWVRAIESSDRLADDIRRQLLTARVLILARGERWDDLNALIGGADEDESSDELPAALARLLVVLTLDARRPTAVDERFIESIRSRAIGALILGGHTNQVLDLASRFRLGGDGGSDGSFIGLYSSALRNYQSMRDMMETRGEGDASPTTDRVIADRALLAAEQMRRALEAVDRDRHAGIVGQAELLLGVSLFHASGADPAQIAARLETRSPLQSAAEAFERAADLLRDREHAAYALWMAIRAMDAHLARGPDDVGADEERRASYAQAFIARFPNDDRSAALRMQQAAVDGTSPEAALQELLAVPRTSSLYDAARRRGANMAFELYRAAAGGGAGDDRAWQASRYLELAEPLFEADRRAALGGDADAAASAVLQGRRMLEVIFGGGGIESEVVRRRGERVLRELGALLEDEALGEALAAVDRAGLRTELLYREAQLALMRHDEARAEAIAERLGELGPDAAMRGARLFYLHFNRQWAALRATGSGLDPDLDSDSGAARIDAARRLIRHAETLAAALRREGATLRDAALVTVLFTKAEAASDVWALVGDEGMLGMARETLDELLQAHPRDQRLLRNWAALMRRSGDDAAAIEAYRRLLPGLEVGSDAWFEMRTLLIEALAAVDQQRAREVLDQHVALYPGFGPVPWGARLRALNESLPARVEGGEPTGAGEGAP